MYDEDGIYRTPSGAHVDLDRILSVSPARIRQWHGDLLRVEYTITFQLMDSPLTLNFEFLDDELIRDCSELEEQWLANGARVTEYNLRYKNTHPETHHIKVNTRVLPVMDLDEDRHPVIRAVQRVQNVHVEPLLRAWRNRKRMRFSRET